MQSGYRRSEKIIPNNDLERDGTSTACEARSSRRPTNLSMILQFPREGPLFPAGRPCLGKRFSHLRRVVLPAPSVISIVDDDSSVRVATNNLLRSRGYIVHAFASAEEFLHSPHFNETSCVIADVQMPAMSGLDLLTAVRAKGYDAPFIFITAFPDEKLRARAMKAGAIGFLAKPFAVPNLIECLKTALEAGRSEAGM
jgi:CheY-like chemotaxis protein